MFGARNTSIGPRILTWITHGQFSCRFCRRLMESPRASVGQRSPSASTMLPSVWSVLIYRTCSHLHFHILHRHEQ